MFILGTALAQEKFRLEYRYEKGKTYRYGEETKFESVQEINGQEMKANGSSSSLIRMDVQDVSDKGVITLIHSYEDMKVNTKMGMMDTTVVLKELLDKKYQTLLSGSGRLIDQKAIDSVNSGVSIFATRRGQSDLYKEFVIFPDSAVKTGDSWNDERSDTLEGSQMVTKTTRKYTLAGEEEKNGHKCRKISFSGTIEIGGKMTQMGMEFFMEGSGETTGFIWIDKESCIMIAKESSTDQDMTMALTGQMQMTIPITTTTNSKFTLVE
jgi:hypothetical protein